MSGAGDGPGRSAAGDPQDEVRGVVGSARAESRYPRHPGERAVGNDNTVKWKRLSLQVPPSPLRPHFVRAKVRVLEYPDARLAVSWGPHRLADSDALGTVTDAHALAA